jgi:glycosyltransferase involved in cell wall biosynthesis
MKNSVGKLSAILITKDEESNIEDCLKALEFCHECIVLDYASTDATREIARRMGAKVATTSDWPGFGRQKQRALEMASTEWVLSLDADERITEKLRGEIIEALTNPQFDGYWINRRSFFLGKEMRYGGWSPDWVLRLARRSKCRFDPALVHEKLIVSGPTARLRFPMDHFSYRTHADILRKQEHYANAAAKMKRVAGERSSFLKAGFRAAWTFLRLYIIRLGFLDGILGLIAAKMKTKETFLKHMRASGAHQNE